MYRILVPKVKLKVLVTQSCLTLCDPMNCSLPGSSVHGFPQEKMTLEWVVIPFSRGWERKWEKMMKEWNDTGVGCHSLLQGIFPTQGLNLGFLHCRQILYHRATREVKWRSCNSGKAKEVRKLRLVLIFFLFKPFLRSLENMSTDCLVLCYMLRPL